MEKNYGISERAQCAEQSMSNFDGVIEDGLEEALMAKPGEVYGDYFAWNFKGYVYYLDGQFHCEVWRYHAPVGLVSSPTLRDLMNDVCSEYGAD